MLEFRKAGFVIFIIQVHSSHINLISPPGARYSDSGLSRLLFLATRIRQVRQTRKAGARSLNVHQ